MFKKLLEEILKKEKDISEAGQIAFVKYKREQLTECFPDFTEICCGICETFPRLVAVKKLPEKSLGAWSDEICEDRVTIACDHGLGLGNWYDTRNNELSEEDFSLMKNCQKKASFYLLTKEETEEVVGEMSEFLLLDVDDFRGNLLGAMYVCGYRKDTSLSEWNNLVEEDERKRKKEREEYEKRRKDERIKKAEDIVTFLSSFQITSTIKDEIDVYVGERKVTGDLSEVKKKFSDFQEEMKRYVSWKEDCEKMRKGEIPIFSYGNFEIYYNGNSIIKVPRNVCPHFIGKEGKTIKATSKILGNYITISQIDEVAISRKAKVRIASWQPEPTLKL